MVQKRKRTAATEDMIGELHSKVTKIFRMTLDQVVEKLEEGTLAEFCVDPKLMNTITKFINDNKIFAVPAEEAEDNPLAKKLEEIRKRGSVVPLVANRD